jgi:hypothetical protein
MSAMAKPDERRRRQVRDRLGQFLYYVYGPATVDDAIQGSTTESREAWKRHWESRKRAAAEEKAVRKRRKAHHQG